MKENKIIERLRVHLEEVKKYYPEKNIIGIFLFGSQNYGTDIETSDIDSKCLIIPTVEQLFFNEKVNNQTLFLNNNEQCSIIDIREYIKMIKKQNINFVEILFTDYRLINQKYRWIWKQFTACKESFAYYSVSQTLNSVGSQALNTLKQYYNNPKENKKIYNVKRLSYFLSFYLESVLKKEKNYKKCLTMEDTALPYYLKKIRTGAVIIPSKELQELEKELKFFIDYSKKYQDNKKEQRIKDLMLNTFLTKFFKKYLEDIDN